MPFHDFLGAKGLELKSHAMVENGMETFGNAKKDQKFYCQKCDYSTSKNKHWAQHLGTTKHNLETFGNDLCRDNRTKKGKNRQTYSCRQCGKFYKTRSGLWKHRDRCPGPGPLLAKAMSDVAEAQKRIVELQEQVVKVVEKSGSNVPVVNNHVRNISINVFLNENCKNAMNLTDFLERLSMSLNDLRTTGNQGHAAGISNVIMKGLEDIPSTERPLHCTDAKRLKFYVKDKDEWNRDSGEKMDHAIEVVKMKHLSTLNEWEKCHPDYLNDPAMRAKWNGFVQSILGASGDVERSKQMRNIKKTVAEGVLVKGMKAE